MAESDGESSTDRAGVFIYSVGSIKGSELCPSIHCVSGGEFVPECLSDKPEKYKEWHKLFEAIVISRCNHGQRIAGSGRLQATSERI